MTAQDPTPDPKAQLREMYREATNRWTVQTRHELRAAFDALLAQVPDAGAETEGLYKQEADLVWKALGELPQWHPRDLANRITRLRAEGDRHADDIREWQRTCESLRSALATAEHLRLEAQAEVERARREGAREALTKMATDLRTSVVGEFGPYAAQIAESIEGRRDDLYPAPPSAPPAEFEAKYGNLYTPSAPPAAPPAEVSAFDVLTASADDLSAHYLPTPRSDFENALEDLRRDVLQAIAQTAAPAPCVHCEKLGRTCPGCLLRRSQAAPEGVTLSEPDALHPAMRALNDVLMHVEDLPWNEEVRASFAALTREVKALAARVTPEGE